MSLSLPQQYHILGQLLKHMSPWEIFHIQKATVGKWKRVLYIVTSLRQDAVMTVPTNRNNVKGVFALMISTLEITGSLPVVSHRTYYKRTLAWCAFYL